MQSLAYLPAQRALATCRDALEFVRDMLPWQINMQLHAAAASGGRPPDLLLFSLSTYRVALHALCFTAFPLLCMRRVGMDFSHAALEVYNKHGVILVAAQDNDGNIGICPELPPESQSLSCHQNHNTLSS